MCAYSLSNIVRTNRKKRMRWVNNVALSRLTRNMYNSLAGKAEGTPLEEYVYRG
jgi:hypothetical protein